MPVSDAPQPPLVDIGDIHIDTSLPPAQRLERFLADIKNPYRFRCGTVVVELEFSGDGQRRLDQILTDYLVAQKTHPPADLDE